MWILAFLFVPIGCVVVHLSNGNPVALWLAIAFILVPVRVGTMNFPYVLQIFLQTISSFWRGLVLSLNSRLNMILVKSSAPLGMLGSMFGLQQTMGAFARAVSPAFVRSVLFRLPFFLSPTQTLTRNIKYNQLQLLVRLLYWASMGPQRKFGVACHDYSFDL